MMKIKSNGGFVITAISATFRKFVFIQKVEAALLAPFNTVASFLWMIVSPVPRISTSPFYVFERHLFCFQDGQSSSRTAGFLKLDQSGFPILWRPVLYIGNSEVLLQIRLQKIGAGFAASLR